MEIENGVLSTFLRPEELAILNKSFNTSHPGVKATISVNVNWRMPDGTEDPEDDIEFENDPEPSEVRKKVPYFRYVLSYNHPLSPQKKSYVVFEQTEEKMDVHEGIQATLDTHLKQTKTCVHSFIRPKDIFGKEFPDGRAFCTQCELALPGILPRVPGFKVISMSCTEDVVAQHNWGNAYIQGGEDGVVLTGKGAYRTAFMEAFPSVNGFGTFIRGEGENILAAEDACWASYQNKINCKGHEWTRTVHGEHRSDGYAQCVHCGLRTSDALPPETLCKVCQTPTTHTYSNGEDYICLTHYYEVPEDERVSAYIEMMSSDNTSENSKIQYGFDYKFITRLESYAFTRLGAEQYEVLKRTLRGVFGFVKNNFYVLMLDAHPLKTTHTYDEQTYEKMAECHEFVIQNWAVIQEYLNGVIENKKPGTTDTKKLKGVNVSDVIPAQYLSKAEVEE